MKKLLRFLVMMVLALGLPMIAQATNGDNLIGVGPVSRAMGGVGVAAPQDTISATFSNPAAMNVGPYCPGSQFDFAATLFAPKVDARVNFGANSSLAANADEKVYFVPAFGISTPVNDKMRVGLAAYGITGLGVDYRNTEIAGTGAVNSTQLMILKFAPTLAYQVNDHLSLGLAAHVVNSALDLDNGTSANYGFGAQLGAIYRFSDTFALGATYQSPISVNHQNVYDLDLDLSMDDVEFEAPQSFAVGLAITPSDRLLLELDGRWLNWADAAGYDVLDWEDQYVLAIGVQYQLTDRVRVRLGYNYAGNQVNEHNNFDGATTIRVQGKDVNRYGYETLRVTGFPAIVEQHVTLGFGVDLTERLSLNFGYMHAFDTTLKSSGTLPDGVTPVELESSLSEDAIDFSLAWRF